jgi:hypothetical protein
MQGDSRVGCQGMVVWRETYYSSDFYFLSLRKTFKFPVASGLFPPISLLGEIA